jgi:propanediol dehydratase small subunit
VLVADRVGEVAARAGRDDLEAVLERAGELVRDPLERRADLGRPVRSGMGRPGTPGGAS